MQVAVGKITACYEKVKMWLQDNLLAVGIFTLCSALVQ
ncbi:hypothetical protein scyTo_0023179, partial [Scyliorhinus torazame]|nr:hypothetical protein [Scyliorhinus torazame]